MEKIYIKLLNEGTEVWRSVEATKNSDATFTVANSHSIPEGENWEFVPGQKVKCKHQVFSGVNSELVAYELA